MYGNYQAPAYFNPQTLQQQTPRVDLVRVSGIESARAYSMPANSTVALFDTNADVFYLRQTDGAGFPTIRIFEFSERKDTPAVNAADYITRKQFDQVIKRITTGGQQDAEQHI